MVQATRRERWVSELPFLHLAGKKIREMDRNQWCARWVAILIVGICCILFTVLEISLRLPRMVTFGFGSAGVILLLFAAYDAEKWKQMDRATKKAKKQKENTE